MKPSFRNAFLAASLFVFGLGLLIRVSSASLSWSAFFWNFGAVLVLVWLFALFSLLFGARIVTGVYNEQEPKPGEPAPASFVVFQRIVLVLFVIATILVFAMTWGV